MLNPKTFVVLTTLLAGLGSGCAITHTSSSGYNSLAPAQRDSLQSAGERFASIRKEMSRAQIEAQLGQPQKIEGRSLTWKIQAAPENFESLVVEFGADGNVVKLKHDSKRSSTAKTSSSHMP